MVLLEPGTYFHTSSVFGLGQNSDHILENSEMTMSYVLVQLRNDPKISTYQLFFRPLGSLRSGDPQKPLDPLRINCDPLKSCDPLKALDPLKPHGPVDPWP